MRPARALAALACFLLAACKEEAPKTPHVDIGDARQCAPCHKEITHEWARSMHARASQGDPLYAAVLSARSKREGAELAQKCAPCHLPRPAPEIGENVGVSCAACHNTSGVLAEGTGGQRLAPAPADMLIGPHDAKPRATTAHATGPAAAHLADGASVCLACHQALANAQQVSLCATGVEWREHGAGASCAACHMPRTPGAPTAGSARPDHASHRFFGPAGLVFAQDERRAAGTPRLELRAAEDTLTAVITSTAGHALPSGFPGRMLRMVARGYDAAGALVQTSSQALQRTYVDEAGKPVMGPYAARIGSDTRLQAGESRSVELELSPQVVRVEAELDESLMAPGLAKMVGLAGSPLLAPRSLFKAELAIPRPAPPPKKRK